MLSHWRASSRGCENYYDVYCFGSAFHSGDNRQMDQFYLLHYSIIFSRRSWSTVYKSFFGPNYLVPSYKSADAHRRQKVYKEY